MQLQWTPWASLPASVELAPRTAGVYEARIRSTNTVVYVGSAGDRRRGVSQRLHAYAVGKSPDSGLSGKAANRALGDPEFCRNISAAAEDGKPWTISRIAVEALHHLGIEVRSAPHTDHQAAEAALIASYPWDQLWNLRR